MKLSRIRKLSFRLLFVYALVIVLIYFAKPDLTKAYFWLGLIPIALGQVVRIWAAGHLSKNKELTTTGPYAYVKNPLYVGTFLIMVGFGVIAQGGRYREWYLNHANWILLGLGLLIFVA